MKGGQPTLLALPYFNVRKVRFLTYFATIPAGRACPPAHVPPLVVGQNGLEP
jgi:hypothetical protein